MPSQLFKPAMLLVCPFLRSSLSESLLRKSLLILAALAYDVLGVRTWRTFTRGAPLSKPAVDIATAQPITDVMRQALFA
ncbi:hypothetical protein Tco_0869184 [Tanacetum coccineum]